MAWFMHLFGHKIPAANPANLLSANLEAVRCLVKMF